MPQFDYTAINQTGRKVRGQIAAASDVELFHQLKDIGLDLIDANEIKERRIRLTFSPKVSTRDKIQLCLHLEQLEKSGVPLLEGLADVRDSTENARMRDALAEIHRDVTAGVSLSAAFAKQNRHFGSIFPALISAGEESGKLEEAFHQLIKHLKWTDEVNGRIRSAIRYPSFMLVVLGGLFFFMMGFVVPQVVDFLRSQEQELPFLTESLIGTSDFTTEYWWVVLSVPVLIYIFLRLAIRFSPGFAFQVDRLILSLPIIGQTVRKISLSRFCHFFAIMFKSGVPILQGLEAAQRVVTNRVLKAALEEVHDQVQTGESLSAAMRGSGQFPSLVLRMVRIGETSGRLAETLDNVTEFYDRDVDELIGRVIGMVEPMLTVIAGTMMAWIIAGVFGPIYDSFENLDF